ncbi:MAG: hypothetical protein KatS3mg061_1890 [Dehalococcoidia bacterium]|nr:MAG: hypothetical protein KatS3mg061_1890 [Dehalococcoidia bacterium]
MAQPSTRRTVAPADIPRPPFPASPALVAGDWVFLGGTLATDWKNGIAPPWRGPADFPYDVPALARQTEGIYETFRTLLRAAGSELAHLVRLDQFTTAHDQFRHYLPVRDRYLVRDRPASTAVAIRELLIPDALIQVDGIAILPREGFYNVGINTPAAPQPRAGYSMAVRAGDWIWCSGASPTDFTSRAAYPGGPGHAQPEEIIVDPNFWYGSEIQNQARYDLKKLALYLESAGSDLHHALKAQVYLTDARDLGGLITVWRECFGDDPPATSVQVIDQMGIAGSRVEINLIALARGSALGREVIRTSAAPPPPPPRSPGDQGGAVSLPLWPGSSHRRGYRPTRTATGRLTLPRLARSRRDAGDPGAPRCHLPCGWWLPSRHRPDAAIYSRPPRGRPRARPLG